MNRPLKQLLQSWQAAGLTHLPKPTPASMEAMAEMLRPAVEAEAVPPVETEEPVRVESPVSVDPVVTQSSPPIQSVVEAEAPSAATIPSDEILSTAAREPALLALSQQVAACQKCQELAGTRKQTVFGVGSPTARVMFVGEAPGADEDAQGEPFVGKAGQLLNKIIGACGWQREEIYICNILRCRPPGNRTPEKVEAENCREFLDAQIRIVNPEYIVCWGSCAAQNLLGVDTPIGRLRQRWYQHGTAKVLCTYHPSYLLRNPDAKKPVWDDMKFLLADMGLTPER